MPRAQRGIIVNLILSYLILSYLKGFNNENIIAYLFEHFILSGMKLHYIYIVALCVIQICGLLVCVFFNCIFSLSDPANLEVDCCVKLDGIDCSSFE